VEIIGSIHMMRIKSVLRYTLFLLLIESLLLH
jgi:hypothetical protein